MIKIKIQRQNDGSVQSVECKGHSGYAESGQDIVCSAVSAIMFTGLLGLKDVSEKEVLYVQRDGYLKFVCPDALTETEKIRQQAILNTMILGLEDVRSGYKAYIKMEER